MRMSGMTCDGQTSVIAETEDWSFMSGSICRCICLKEFSVTGMIAVTDPLSKSRGSASSWATKNTASKCFGESLVERSRNESFEVERVDIAREEKLGGPRTDGDRTFENMYEPSTDKRSRERTSVNILIRSSFHRLERGPSL